MYLRSLRVLTCSPPNCPSPCFSPAYATGSPVPPETASCLQTSAVMLYSLLILSLTGSFRNARSAQARSPPPCLLLRTGWLFSIDRHLYRQHSRRRKGCRVDVRRDRKSTRLNSSHDQISYAVFCLTKKKKNYSATSHTQTSKHKHITRK